MMNKYRIIFSPTGGTEKVSKSITKNWGHVEDIDLTIVDKDYHDISLTENDIALIAMPSYAGLAPQIALDRLARINAHHCKCVIVAVYGNRAYEDTLVQMEDYAHMAGFDVIGAMAAIAEHSIFHQFATGRPDENDCHQLEEFGNQILEKVIHKIDTKPNIPGHRPYKKAGGGTMPQADSSCTKCGLCAIKCPTGAISQSNPQVTDKDKCISCMRCVAVCPSQARKLDQEKMAVIENAITKVCSIKKECELFL